ncbi:hypothetical protein D3C84_659370 [compost metagenome]
MICPTHTEQLNQCDEARLERHGKCFASTDERLVDVHIDFGISRCILRPKPYIPSRQQRDTGDQSIFQHHQPRHK